MASRKGVVAYRDNPFLKDLAEMQVRKKRITVKADKVIIDPKTGEYEDTAEITKVFDVDADQFVKVFTTNMKAFFSLKPSTYQLLNIIIMQLSKEFQGSSIYLNYGICKRYFEDNNDKGFSVSSFHTAIKELIQKGFIAESEDSNLYWINPTLLFNGDRIKFAKEYRLKKSNQHDLNLENRENSFQTDIESYIANSE